MTHLNEEGMAGTRGSNSNPKSCLAREWNAKADDTQVECDWSSDTLKLEELFSTLAEWNEYLENHVPYFADKSMDGGPK
jgi:hypothetical protein